MFQELSWISFGGFLPRSKPEFYQVLAHQFLQVSDQIATFQVLKVVLDYIFKCYGLIRISGVSCCLLPLLRTLVHLLLPLPRRSNMLMLFYSVNIAGTCGCCLKHFCEPFSFVRFW